MSFNIRRSLQSVVRCSRLTGLFPFSIDEDGSVRISIPLLILSILIQSLLTLFKVSFFIYRGTSEFIFNYIYEILISMGQFSIQYAQISLIISLITNRELLNETFKTLVLMENVDEPINSNGCLWYPTFCGIILVGTPIMELASDMYHFLSIELIFIILQWELAYFAIFQFTGLLAVCRTCFKALEKRLKTRLKGSVYRYSKWEAVERSEQLIKCCETINKCYGPMLLIMLISFFGLITTNLYAAYLNSKDKWSVFICVLSAFILLTTFHYLVQACTETAEMVNMFNLYIHRSLIQDILTECVENTHYLQQRTDDTAAGDSDNDTSNENENTKPNATLKKIIFQSTLAMEAINRKELEFTANGYFAINYSLFYSMIETSATYLIICIQSSEFTSILYFDYNKPSDSTVFSNNDTDFINETFVI